jgi:chromosome segregation ATPase
MDWINQLGTRMEELATAQANSEGKIAALVDAQIHTEDAVARLAEAQRRTEQTAAESNARLDRLAAVVEKLISDRNGKG